MCIMLDCIQVKEIDSCTGHHPIDSSNRVLSTDSLQETDRIGAYHKVVVMISSPIAMN